MTERVIHIVDYHQRKNNNQTLFNKQLRDTPTCREPWNNLIINQGGISYICMSPAWLPKSIGSVLDYDNIFDLLNSYEAQSIRTEILNNRYSYCNSNICNFFAKIDRSKFNSMPDKEFALLSDFPESAKAQFLPKEIVLDFDYTCNFVCPSCRTELINHNKGNEADINDQIVERVKNIIDNVTQPTVFRWAGGEPFISRAYNNLWQYMIQVKNPLIQNVVQTNGSYLQKKSDLLLEFLPYMSKLVISFDAGSAETYSKTRVNGNWETLLDNARWVKQAITETHAKTELISSYVVQLSNYQEIPNYIKICKDIGFDVIRLGKMWSWGTWSDEEFARLNVSDSKHPNYEEFLNIIRTPEILNDAQIRKGYWINDL